MNRAHFLSVLFLAGCITFQANAETVHLQSVAVTPMSWRTNMLSNPGFEEIQSDGTPAGWAWDRRNTDAVCVADHNHAHGGHQSILMTNGTSFGANIYGMLWRREPAKLVVGKTYTMSAWVQSAAPGLVTLAGGGHWQIRAAVEPTGGQWQRIVKSFSPDADDCDFTLRFITESPTRGVWIDDVRLEEGPEATIDLPASLTNGAVMLPLEPALTIQGDGPFHSAFMMVCPCAREGSWSVTLSTGETLSQPDSLGAGLLRIVVNGDALGASDTPRTLRLRWATQGSDPVPAEMPIRFFSASNVLGRAAALRGRLPALVQDLKTLEARGVDTAYPRVTATILENFIGYADEDAQRGEVRRGLEQVADLEAMAACLEEDLPAALAGQKQFAPVPRWTGSQRPVVSSSSFLAPVRLPGGATGERPVFFTGYGHFGQVVDDLEKWPGYGGNIIQIEIGPGQIFPAEGVTNLAPVAELLRTLDRAQKSGVAVCLLISPHYFPEWALAKWPQLRRHRDGFLNYCLHASEGQELLRRYLTVLIPPIKDHPALHSVCLSNEPVNQEEPCPAAQVLWQTWLARRHGDIAHLNSVCGSSFASFAAVPLPDPFSPWPVRPLFMDYVRFNQEFFADWHKQLADIIHALAPGLPVHAKAMTWTMISGNDAFRGVDATLFGRFSDLNGNDSVNLWEYRDGEFAQQWLLNAVSHDLQRSVLDAPVFNTENHLIADRDTRPVPPAHIRAALWQAAVHGQSATAIWVWERTFDPKSDFYGSIMHRPACVEAVGVVNYDLNRAALEVTALQQDRPQVLLLQSTTASVWEGGEYTDCLDKLYTALSFTGLKPGFITERQLESGSVPSAPVVIVPDITHLSDAAFGTLRRYHGRLIWAGDRPPLSANDWNQPRVARLAGETLEFHSGATSAHDLYAPLSALLSRLGVQPVVELRDLDGRAAWGVEWRSAVASSGRVVNLCNYRREPATVALYKSGESCPARDVLTEAPVTAAFTLAPLEVRLLRLGAL